MPFLTALIICYLLTWLLIPYILLSNKRPVATIAWIWSIVLFPFIGPLCYLAFGSERIHRKRLRRRAKFQVDHSGKPRLAPDGALHPTDQRDRDLLKLLARLNGSEAAPALEIQLLYGAHAFFGELLRAVEAAEHHVHVQFYIWRDDSRGRELLEALIRAAERGVEVRLVIDEIGSVGLRSRVFIPLIEAGGKFSWALTIDPLRNRFFWHLRNHRKLQIIDGCIAFVGGMNVGREYFGEDSSMGDWRDAQLKVVGPVVALLQESFADDWYFATEEKLTSEVYYTAAADTDRAARDPENAIVQIVSGGPDSSSEPIQKSLVALLNHASKRVWITTGYFVPNHLMLTSAQLCAARDVDVRFLLAGRSDFQWLVHAGRSYYEELLTAGVRLWEYHAGFMHAKMMLIDDEWFMIGSANWDIRSMRLNFELGALVKSRPHAAQLETIFLEEFARADEIRLEEFVERPFRQRLREAVVRPISPLL